MYRCNMYLRPYRLKKESYKGYDSLDEALRDTSNEIDSKVFRVEKLECMGHAEKVLTLIPIKSNSPYEVDSKVFKVENKSIDRDWED